MAWVAPRSTIFPIEGRLPTQYVILREVWMATGNRWVSVNDAQAPSHGGVADASRPTQKAFEPGIRSLPDNFRVPSEPVDIDLSIIVVSFNTLKMTLECLRSIYAETLDTKFEIIVVDNNSRDGSADAIRSEFSEVKLIALKENIGFARANNLAANQAHGRKILLLNPDTVVIARAIDHLVAFSNETPSYRLWGGRTLNTDGSLNVSSCWRRMSLWNLTCFTFGLCRLAPMSPFFNSESYGGWDRNTVRHVDIVTGCFLMIDRALWENLRGFDPDFFMYAEDADLCHRARRAGARPTITPTAEIIHHGSVSEASEVDKRTKLFKGKVTLMKRHWSPLTQRLGRVLFLLVPLLRWPTYRLLARITHEPRFDSISNDWRTIWRCRQQWIEGYPSFNLK
jgi:GT2 family glycosyltransferase